MTAPVRSRPISVSLGLHMEGVALLTKGIQEASCGEKAIQVSRFRRDSHGLFAGFFRKSQALCGEIKGSLLHIALPLAGGEEQEEREGTK